MSRILNTGLDMETLAAVVRLCENGVNPEALAMVFQELKKESAAVKVYIVSIVDFVCHHERCWNLINWACAWENQQFGFWPGPTQTGLYSHRRWLEAGNFGFRKKRNCTIRVAKTKALISFAVIEKLICAFIFAYADCCSDSIVKTVGNLVYMLCMSILKKLIVATCMILSNFKLSNKTA